MRLIPGVAALFALVAVLPAAAAPPPPRLDAPLWSRTLGTPGFDYAEAIVAGRDGSVYVAANFGVTPTAGESLYIDDVVVARYSASGRLLWRRMLRAKTQQYAAGLAQGADGTIMVAAWRSADPGYSAADTYLYRLKPNGVVAEQHLFRRSFSASKLVASGAGYLLSGFSHEHPGGSSVFKLDPGGRVLWSARLSGSHGGRFQAIAAMPDGGAVFAADGEIDPRADPPVPGLFVVRFDRDGRETWRATDPLFAGSVHDVAVLANGDIAIAATQWGDYGAQRSLGDQDVFVARYSGGGTRLWAKLYGGAGYDGAAAVGETDGRLVVAGTTDSPRFEGPVADGTAFVLTLDASGVRQAVSTFDGSPHDMAVDGRRIYLAGDVRPPPPDSQEDAVVMRVR